MANSITTVAIQSRAELSQFEADWLDLESRAGHDVFFQSFGWATSVWDFELERDNAKFSPLIILAYDGDAPVAILPLELINTGLRRVLVPIGFIFAQISNLIVAPSYNSTVLLEQMLAGALKAKGADSVYFPKVRDHSLLDAALPHTDMLTGETSAAPVVELSAFPDYASYLQTIRPKTRKNIRNARNKLEREAPLVHKTLHEPESQARLIKRTLAWRAERLHEQGLTSRAFSASHLAEFCISLVRRPHMRLAAFSYLHGERPLAEQWGFVHAGRYYCYVTSRDFSHIEESPGKLHLAEIIRSSKEMGLEACDLGVPDMPYKQTWATHTVMVRDYILPITKKGKIIGQLWDVQLRPKLKSLLLKAPTPVRAGIMRIIGRTI